ncbi:MAG: LPS-assembly protein LptD [Verrucomicrobia bacterium]|nr:LPS-assembly protein LptD [Verrucomicrobiota bacterium]
MRMRAATVFFLLLPAAPLVPGAVLDTPQNQPIEITSTGETRYENGVAFANGDVAIHLGDTDIYADSAQYDSHKHEVTAEGHVRIYRENKLYIAQHGTYNLDTKEVHADQMRTSSDPYLVSGQTLQAFADNHVVVQDGIFTTDDASNPNFHLRAHKVRIYENDRVIFQNVTFYIGNIPVFWWPYLYQSLNDAFSFSVSPAFLSEWGPSLLTEVTFPIYDKLKGRVRLDYRTRRGAAIGFETDINYGKDDNSFAHLVTYFADDQNPNINRTALDRTAIGSGRYRITLQDRTEFTDDIYGIVDVTKLSDPYLLQDFYQSEFRLNPNPDNVVAVTKTDPIYTLTGIARFQANAFFETTERLPEIALDIKRTPIFGSPIFYEGETSIADLRRDFPVGSVFQDYESWRLDSFHQLLFPNTYFGWLSIVPRVGFRATYYSETRDVGKTIFPTNNDPFTPTFLLPDNTQLYLDDARTRLLFNAGVEASFKLSRAWEDVQSRWLGLDGLRHVIQPFTNFSWVSNGGVDPAAILQFDRYEPSTQLRPIDFPQFTSIDSIDHWTVWRFGVSNRLETRRDDSNVTWLELQNYFDVNIDNPYDREPYSNFFTKVRFNPVPWASLSIDSQVPAFDKGFTEVNTTIAFQPISRFQINLSHRYLYNNPSFQNSSLFDVGGYYRINDNWGVAIEEQYEAATGVIQQQRYAVYRDLSSWVASFGAVVRDNAGVKEYGVLLTFTLKAFPRFGFNLNFDPGGAGQ